MMEIEAKLAEMGLALPPPLPSAGAYAPYIASGGLLFISGQVPVKDGRLICGRVGADLDEAQGQEAARFCGLAVLAQVKAACGGDFDQVTRAVRLGGFVNAAAEFDRHPEIINGASELLLAVMGERGRHSRFAVGVSSLPRGCAVEIEACFEMKS